MPRFRIHHLVASEIDIARTWYAGHSLIAAQRFIEAFYAALGRVQRYPTSHAPWRPPYRRIRLVRFPYLIIYHSDRRQTSVLLLSHERREPVRVLAALQGRLSSFG